MSRVIIFSRVFPLYHRRRGELTYFVEQLQNSLCLMNLPIYSREVDLPTDFLESLTKQNVGYKHHTIRAGHRFKVGDKFSPRVWSAKPYNSKQIQFAPDIEVKKVFDLSFLSSGIYRIGERQYDESHYELIELIAKNDGLSKRDFLEWFMYPKYFDGQIICWNETINY